jgi:hypothetical protein
LQSTTYFCSLNAPDQRLCYDFKNRRVRPTHYSIHACFGHYLRSWTFEGSVDGSSWFALDEQKGNSTTNSDHPIGTFSVVDGAECRFIRIRQRGEVHVVMIGLSFTHSKSSARFLRADNLHRAKQSNLNK